MLDLISRNDCKHMVRNTSVEGVETTCIKCGFPFYNANKDSIINRYLARKKRVQDEIRRELMQTLIKDLKWFTLR